MLARFVVLPLFFWSSAAMATGLDFELKNATGYDIEAVYVDPSDSEEWSGNILQDDAELPDGASASVTFDGDPESCKWDIRSTGSATTSQLSGLTSIFARFQRSL